MAFPLIIDSFSNAMGMYLVDPATGLAAPAGTSAAPMYFLPGALTAGGQRSGTATTTSGGFAVAGNALRRGLVGQNVGTVNIGFNEFNGVAVIGAAGTYTVPPGASFSVSTTNTVNFICATGTCPVTVTEY